MGLGVSTKKRAFYDNSVRVKIFDALLCQKHKQNLSCSSNQRLVLWVPPQAERGGCMQGNGLEKESWAHLPFHSSSRPLLSLLADANNNKDASEAPIRCKTVRAAGWLSVIRSTIYSIVIASRMLVAALGCSCGVVRRHPEDDPLESWGNSQSHGRASRAGFCSFTHLSTLSPGVCRDVFCGLKMPGTSPAE